MTSPLGQLGVRLWGKKLIDSLSVTGEDRYRRDLICISKVSFTLPWFHHCESTEYAQSS